MSSNSIIGHMLLQFFLVFLGYAQLQLGSFISI